MNDHPKQQSRLRSALLRLRRWLRHPLTTELTARRELYVDLLRQAGQIQSLEDLLQRFPERLGAELDLEHFHVFVLEQDAEGQAWYRLAGHSGEPVRLPASSAVVARMKRERRPSLLDTAPGVAPDAWQLLATEEELKLLDDLGAQVLFPFAGRTRLAGFAALRRTGGHPFTPAELRLFHDLGPGLGRGLETALLLESLSQEAVERDRQHCELLLAREVQEHLLPELLPQSSSWELAASYRSASEVGGDYYDAFLTASGALCLVVADVSGKGVPAALVMAALRASLHALVPQPGFSLAGLVGQLNELLFASSAVSRYATLFVALLPAGAAELQYCNAGHNAPALLRADGEIDRLEGGGTVLGLFAGAQFRTQTVPFRPGDALVSYTDGVTEAVNLHGSEWGEDGLHTVLRVAHRSTPSINADALLQQVETSLGEFTAGTSLLDDATLLILTCCGTEGSDQASR